MIGSMILSRLGRAKADAAGVAGLLLLCFLGSLGSLRSDLLPHLAVERLPPLERQVAPFALLAVVAALLAVRRGAECPRGRQVLDSMVAGLGLFAVPAGLIAFSKGWIADLTRVALFSLAPVFAVVLEPYIGRGTGQQARGGLIAALAAVVGTLCVFPVETPRSMAAGSALCAVILAAACVAAANCRAVAVANESAGNSTMAMAAIAGATAAAGLAAASALMERGAWRWDAPAPELAWSAAVELPGLLLLFWLMRRLSAVRMMTRFVLTPIFAILISMALLRPTVGPLTWLGLLLVAGGAGWLLFAREEEPEAGSLPLKLER